MGVTCETIINTPPDGAFTPGSAVSGVVRYSIIDVPVKRIVISLRGAGILNVTKGRYIGSYTNSEDYVNTATFVNLNENDKSSGHVNTAQFQFQLPDNIPSSMIIKGQLEIICNMLYNLRVEFVVSGRFSWNKVFEKDIKVVSTAIRPALSMTPLTRIETKKLFTVLSKKNNVKIKATIQSCVLRPGGRLELAYEVENETNIDIISVETRLVEVYKYYDSNVSHAIAKVNKAVPNMQSKSAVVKSGESLKTRWEVDLPPNIYSIENSKMVIRSYACVLTTVLPVPHKNYHVVIPLQIGTWDDGGQSQSTTAGPSNEEPPPSYWLSTDNLNFE
ncbi:uncharacterized protein LOC114354007 [Ostrinia furnacalis]|uniref:uncharacterized protein LOC114354007 n=1 Tax=Ostrinia furnacalis TaxID=93504 RepID=UPI001040D466|nr:uncharacterized protein LOC114354007 [Ostrinia furnacalis]